MNEVKQNDIFENIIENKINNSKVKKNKEDIKNYIFKNKNNNFLYYI